MRDSAAVGDGADQTDVRALQRGAGSAGPRRLTVASVL